MPIEELKSLKSMNNFEKTLAVQREFNGSFVMIGLIRLATHQSSLYTGGTGHTDV